MSQSCVPVLITWDVDPDRWATLEQREEVLSLAMDLSEEFGIRSTFFITSEIAEQYCEDIERMFALGCEVGCHGLEHTDREDYAAMPEEMQRIYINMATQKLMAVTGEPILSFRSPRVKTSGIALRTLADYGYRVDSSVCSQRFDVVSSNLINIGWLKAPRKPYHPHQTDAFKRGDNPIWEIPVSALFLPFISTTLRVFGLFCMRILFLLLYFESKHTGKPIVYLAHPTEFIMLTGVRRFRLKDFSPKRIRDHGFLIRTMFYRLQGKVMYQVTRRLFGYIAAFPEVSFLTCSEYAQMLETYEPQAV